MSTEHLVPAFVVARNRLLARRQRVLAALCVIEQGLDTDVPDDAFRYLQPRDQQLEVLRLREAISRAERLLHGGAR